MSKKKKENIDLVEVQEPLLPHLESEIIIRHTSKRLYLFKAYYKPKGTGVYVSKVTCEVNGAQFDMDKCIQYIGKERLDEVIRKGFVTARVCASRPEVVLSPQAY